MAKYSYTSGMEDRGLNWLWIPVVAANPTKAGSTNQNSKVLSSALTAIYGSNYEVIILENYIIPNGSGGFFNCLFVYDMNDPRRLPTDGIRFHDGGQNQFAKPITA